ncbi:hypothetical protein NBRC116583_00880 [Arenicella sp. 4NH20-0111]
MKVRYPTRFFVPVLLFISALLPKILAAAPGTPSLAWMPASQNASTQFAVRWDMWWGDNATSWRLFENGVEIYSSTISDNSPNAQFGEHIISKEVGGQYTYYVEICDDNGLSCVTSNSRNVTVTGGSNVNQAPVISVLGDNPFTLFVGDVFTDPGASATDDKDGSVGVVSSGVVNAQAAGTYQITYNATDSDGLAAESKVREVLVVADVLPPMITLIGADTINIGVGEVFDDPGATGVDNRDGAVEVVVSGSVNSDVIGTYSVSYNASDAAGNQAVEVIRTVIVEAFVDTQPPVISLLGSSSVSLSLGSEFTDPGYTVIDNVDANVVVAVSGAVDTSTVGVYPITYTAADAAGNQAIPVTRTVAVVGADSNEILSLFTQATTDPINWTTVITLTYQSSEQVDLKGAKITIAAYQTFTSVNLNCEGVDPTPIEYSFEVDTQTGEQLTVLALPYSGANLDSQFGGLGQTCSITLYPGAISDGNGDPYDGSAIRVIGITTSEGSVSPSSSSVAPSRLDPVNLEVVGWPSTLAMGTITDNSSAITADLAAADVDSIFKYAGDGTGNRGALIEPVVVRQTIEQSRSVETLRGKSVNPVLVIYTANASNGGVASEDISNYTNLVMHYRNLIRQAATMQSYKDANHVSPGSIILNPDLFGEWQKNRDSSFATAFGTAENWTPILVRQALKEAISADADYVISNNLGATSSLSSLYDLAGIKSEIDAALDDNILGWVQSQNLVLSTFSPDVTFSWVLNLWNPGSANWVHDSYSGMQAVWNEASKSVSEFVESIGAYTANSYRPDFIAFDKYERDGFSPTGRANYAFGSREWDNYLTYVRQITDSVDTPAMLWQIPGGHLPSNDEEIGSYDIENNASSAATYFMGDKSIGASVLNIRSEVLTIPLNPVVYNGSSSVADLLQTESNYDWGASRLRHAAYSNVFAILWGGGSTTAVVPIATNGAGDNGWLSNKIQRYQNAGQVPLYHIQSDSNTQALTSIAALNNDLNSVENVMNNSVFLYETPSNAMVPSSIYKWADFLDALNPMHNTGIAGVKFWLTDPDANEVTNVQYAKVAIAAFLAQSMKETIKFDACDENNWSINTGDPVNYPLSSSCGQLQQVYGDYGMNANGSDNPYSCPRNPKMEITAKTHASWYGAPGPLFTAPDAVLQEKGLLVNGSVGRWSYSGPDCSSSTAEFNAQAPAYLRDECAIYDGQKAGGFVWDGSAGKSLEGCGWWGRGVIQTTGRLNFGKLNHFLGRSHVDPDNINQTVEGTFVEAAPSNPLFADLDLCSNPELICSTQEHKEIKWVAGLFFWMNEVQGYNVDSGPYANWNYYDELKAYVDGGMTGNKFIDDVSGIVNRGCPDATCPVSGAVDGIGDRRANFFKVLEALGLNPQ